MLECDRAIDSSGSQPLDERGKIGESPSLSRNCEEVDQGLDYIFPNIL
jgi:hypothetical protein